MKALKGEQISKFLSKYAIYLILVVMIVTMTILKPDNFPTWPNFRNILRQMTTVGIIAIGATFPIISGGIDISCGSMVGLYSVIVAQFAHPGSDGVSGEYPLVVPILITLAIGATVGLIIGAIISYGKVPPFIVTLGMLYVGRGMAMVVSNGKIISNLTDEFNFIGGGSVLGVLPVPIIIFALCGVIGYIILHRTKFGAHVFAIGGNANAARVSGINIKKATALVYVIAGILTSVAAIVITSREQSGQPGGGVGYEMQAITCVIVGGCSFSGGSGTILGTITGAIIIGILYNAMTLLYIDPYWQMVTLGAILIFAVMIDSMKKRKE